MTALPSSAPHAPRPMPRRVRRVNRAREHSSLFHLMRALPEGSTRARNMVEWLEAVEDAATRDGLRADRRATVLGVADALRARAVKVGGAAGAITARPTWAFLMERTGRSRATVARALVWLRGHGLLGTVATGRSAAYAAAGADGERINEAAVYLLAVVRPLVAVEGVPGPVDVNETPPPGGVIAPPARAHARGLAHRAEPLRGLPAEAARPDRLALAPDVASAPRAGLVPQRRPASWPAAVTTASKDERLAAARSLRERLPVLRRLSAEHVRALIRPYLLAGWTVGDLAHAIDHRPGGTPWPHDGAHGVENVGAWLRYRLAAWMDDAGTVLPGPVHQRARAEAARLAARARARAEAEAAARAAAVPPVGNASWQAMKAALAPRAATLAGRPRR